MKRKEKYPDTEYFKFYNVNSHNRLCGDCVIRAIAMALNQTWEDTLTDLYNIGIKTGYTPTDDKTIEKYLGTKHCIKYKEPRTSDNKKMTVKEWLSLNKPDYNIIAYVGCHHLVAIVDSKVIDTWNSSLQIMHSYWRT